MAASLLTSQNPMPMTAAPAPEGARLSQPSVVPAGKAGSGRSFSDELMKPSAAPSGSQQATPVAAAGTVVRPTPTKSLQDAQVSDSSTTVDQAPKRTLATVKQDVGKSPAVAMLTGKLDRVPATDIPALVTGNKFINDALSTDEIPEYLNKPAAVADLVKDLGLPPQVLQQVQTVGLDPGQKVTPSAFLKAMGIDPQRVMAELTQLKANLPLEGLAPYINRAQALNPKAADLVAAGAPQPQPLLPQTVQPVQVDRLGQLGQQQIPGPTQVTPTIPVAAEVDPIGFAWIGKPNTVTPAPLEPKPYLGLSPGLQAPAEVLSERPSQSEDLSPQALLAAMQGLPRAQRPTSDLLKATPWTPADERVVVAASMLRAPSGVDDSLEAIIARANPDGSLDVLTLQDAPLARPSKDLGQPATLNKASFDAFAQLGAKMRAADTVVLADPVLPQRAVSLDPFLNEQILSRSLDESGKPEAAFALLKGRANDPGVVMMQVKTTEVAAVIPASGSSQGARLESLDQKALLRDLMENNSNGFSMTKAETFKFDAPQSSAQPLQELRLQSPMLVMSSEEKNGDRNSSGGEQPGRDPGQQSEHGKGLRELGLSLHQPQAQQTHTTSFATSATVAVEPLTVQNRFDLMQKVVNHATMLSKQGGGTVRLDLSSPEFGPLELALNMNKDKIDLRVLAGSDRARDAIAADLNQLKGALAIQNVQLGKVEVGVNGRQPQSQQQFTGMNQQGGRQQMGGRSQDEWRGQVSAPQVNPVSAVTRPRVPAAMLQGQVNDQGRIAVRA